MTGRGWSAFSFSALRGGSYYASERELTKENADVVFRCIKADGERVVRTIVAISQEGRAPKNDPALFALALVAKHGDVDTRRYALGYLHLVARTGSHILQFALKIALAMLQTHHSIAEHINDDNEDVRCS